MNPQQSTKMCDIKYKIVFLGQMNTGKTSIIDRFAKNTFNQRIQQTIGIDLITRNLSYNMFTYKLQLWDTAGQQKYRSLVPNYIRDAHCAVFVYDVGDQKTLQNLVHWYQLYKNYQPPGAIAILVGNKIDQKQRRVVDVNKGYEWAKKYDMAFSQVSAKTGQGIEDVFHSIVDNINVNGQAEQQQEQQPPGSQTNVSRSKKQVNNNNNNNNNDTKIVKIQSFNQLSQSSRLNKRTILQLKQKKKRQYACCYI